MGDEVTAVGKLNWFAFLAELLPRASQEFLKCVTLSPSFLDEFSEILDVGGLPLITAFLSLVEHLMSADPAAVRDALAPTGLVFARFVNFLEVPPADKEHQDTRDLADALFTDIYEFE
jgi:hypothetical protein